MLYIPKNILKGKIKKVKSENEHERSRYDFLYKNSIGFNTTVEGISHQFDKGFWNLARLISSHLQLGTPLLNIKKIVSKLDDGGDESINTWKNGVIRALKRYIPNGTKETGEVCPNCGSDSLVYQEGCLICKNCGSSKCG